MNLQRPSLPTIRYKPQMNANRLTLLTAAGIAVLFAANALANHNTRAALESRIAPVGKLNVVEGGAASAQVAVGDADGAAVYGASCVACHAAGIAGAPKLGDVANWQPRIAQGEAVLIDHAINGYQGAAGVMPAKGGNPNLSDAEVIAAVEYMIEQSK